MRLRCDAGRVVRFVVLAVGVASPLQAQVFHLPPAHRRILPPDQPVLTIKALNPPVDGASIVIDDDRIVVTAVGGKQLTNAPLANRSIRDVMNQLLADLDAANVQVMSVLPLLPASYIGSLKSTTLSNVTTTINANGDEPELRIGFGVVMSLAEPDPEKPDAGLLAQAGFQLDVVGNHQMLGPANATASQARKNMPLLYAQWRLGLNADQQIQLDKSEATAGQFESALGQADQVALSGQLDFEFPSAGRRFAFVLTPSYAINWTRLRIPPFPQIEVGVDTFKPSEEVFTADAIKVATADLLQPEPLSEGGLMATIQYRRREEPLFYVGAGVMEREILIPGVRFKRSAVPPGSPAGTPGAPDPTSLRGLLRRGGIPVWRATMGARMAGVLDVRLDASGSIGRERTKPLLRVLLARAFPVGG